MRQFNLKTLWHSYKKRILAREHHDVNQAFMSATVELQERPPSPTVRFLLWGLVGFIIFALLWSIFGRVDIVAIGQGQIIPSGRVKVIQPLEAGIVQNILVTEGAAVTAGQPLIELDITLTQADVARLQDDLNFTQASLARLTALRDGTEPLFPADLPAALQTSQQNLFNEIRTKHTAEMGSLTQQLERTKREQDARRATLSRLNKTLPLITERVESLERLEAQKFVARSQLLSLQEQRLNQVYERETIQHQLAELAASEAEIQERLRATEAAFKQQMATELAEQEQRLNQLTQELTKAERRNTQNILRAPIDGTVQELQIHTLGGVVTPAQELMKIIPTSDSLIAEILIPNKDIGFVELGQSVKLKFEAFPFTKYGYLTGDITNISLDAIQDQNLGLVYAVKIGLDETHLSIRDKKIPITTGLALTGEIKTGKRRIIAYFLSPIAIYQDEAIRER